jgi:hypothetical protein
VVGAAFDAGYGGAIDSVSGVWRVLFVGELSEMAWGEVMGRKERIAGVKLVRVTLSLDGRLVERMDAEIERRRGDGEKVNRTLVVEGLLAEWAGKQA